MKFYALVFQENCFKRCNELRLLVHFKHFLHYFLYELSRIRSLNYNPYTTTNSAIHSNGVKMIACEWVNMISNSTPQFTLRPVHTCSGSARQASLTGWGNKVRCAERTGETKDAGQIQLVCSVCHPKWTLTTRLTFFPSCFSVMADMLNVRHHRRYLYAQ